MTAPFQTIWYRCQLYGARKAIRGQEKLTDKLWSLELSREHEILNNIIWASLTKYVMYIADAFES